MTANKNKAKKITLLVAFLYCLIGNIIGYLMLTSTIPLDGILSYIFLPYRFIWILFALSQDYLIFLFEILAFAITLLIFYPIGLYYTRAAPR